MCEKVTVPFRVESIDPFSFGSEEVRERGLDGGRHLRIGLHLRERRHDAVELRALMSDSSSSAKADSRIFEGLAAASCSVADRLHNAAPPA